MNLTTPKARSRIGEPHPSSSLDEISALFDELRRRVERFDRVRPRVASSGPELETAVSGLRASADVLASPDRDLRALVDKARDSSSMRGSADADAFDDLEERIGSIRDTIAAFRAESRREGTVRKMASVIEILDEKIEALQSRQGNSPGPADVALKPERSVPEILASIERGIADLLKEVNEVRADNAQRSTGRLRAPASNFERDPAELQQTHSVAASHTRTALAAVHGTLDDLVARMASLESKIRDRATARQAAPIADPAPELAPSPTSTRVYDSAPIPERNSENGRGPLTKMPGVGLVVATQSSRTETANGTLQWSCWSRGTAYQPRSSATFAGIRLTSIAPADQAEALGQPFQGIPVDAGAAAGPTEIPRNRGEAIGLPANKDGSSHASDEKTVSASATRAPHAAPPKHEPAAVNLHDVIRSCVLQCQPNANLAYGLIRTSLFPIPLTVRVDAEMLRELIVHLLKYAIKSMRSGGQVVVSSASPLDVDGKPAGIVVRVRCRGSGLKDPELSAALDVSAEGAASELALAKARAEAINAGFAVTNGANGTTVVTIAFPRSAAANDPGPA
jgi:hypothetical protein